MGHVDDLLKHAVDLVEARCLWCADEKGSRFYPRHTHVYSTMICWYGTRIISKLLHVLSKSGTPQILAEPISVPSALEGGHRCGCTQGD